MARNASLINSQNSVLFHLGIYLFLRDILKKYLRVTNSAKILLYLKGFFTFSLFSRNISVLKGACLTLYRANQRTSFYMTGTSIMKELIDLKKKNCHANGSHYLSTKEDTNCLQDLGFRYQNS